MLVADGGHVGVMGRDLAPIADALAEQLAGVQMVGGVTVAAAAGVGEGEIHHAAQGEGGGQGMVGAQLLRCGTKHGVLIAIQAVAALHDQFGGPAEG